MNKDWIKIFFKNASPIDEIYIKVKTNSLTKYHYLSCNKLIIVTYLAFYLLQQNDTIMIMTRRVKIV